jgi:uncharacterized protein
VKSVDVKREVGDALGDPDAELDGDVCGAPPHAASPALSAPTVTMACLDVSFTFEQILTACPIRSENSRQARAARRGGGEVPCAKRDNPCVATGSALRTGRLGPGHAEMLSRLLDREPVVNAYLRSELRMGIDGGDWWGVADAQGLRATALGGALVVPCIPKPEDARALGETLAASATPRMLVGPRDAVLALHDALGRAAREVRDPQHLMLVDRQTFRHQPASAVRRARPRDIDALVVAAAAMHREEMGVDPLSIDAPGWRARMASLVDRGWSWVWTERETVIFKAELSAWTPNVVQIQGVWTHPAQRSHGVGRAGLASVCEALFDEVPLCTLYVNHYNTIAIALYRSLGFRKIADFATVIY